MEQILKHLGCRKVVRFESEEGEETCFDPGLFHFKYSSVTEVITYSISLDPHVRLKQKGF